jgi:hypothetical protein
MTGACGRCGNGWIQNPCTSMMYLQTLDDLTRGNLRSSDGMDTHLDITWAESALQRQGSWEIDWAGAWIGLQGGDVIGTCGGILPFSSATSATHRHKRRLLETGVIHAFVIIHVSSKLAFRGFGKRSALTATVVVKWSAPTCIFKSARWTWIVRKDIPLMSHKASKQRHRSGACLICESYMAMSTAVHGSQARSRSRESPQMHQAHVRCSWLHHMDGAVKAPYISGIANGAKGWVDCSLPGGSSRRERKRRVSLIQVVMSHKGCVKRLKKASVISGWLVD